ncbi:hypothetical protein [Natronolimnobius baerhuensis]|uniref:hypothetical protein n=1 Tax=Natronolimnobius baerhuensis TaxID=253108 RepID=UPI001595C0FF|nr:hypothetical protein [Natronolimnobius baerhuensis]
MEQVTETQAVACPHCGDTSTIPVPTADVDLQVRPYVAAFGEYRTIDCANDHTFWVYFC